MSKRNIADLEYGFDDDLEEDLVDFDDDDLLEDSDEQEQVLELEQVEPQAKKLKQSYNSQLFEDREAVVIILDSPHHDHDFYYLNRNNSNRNLLEIKLQSTSFLVSEFSKPKYERFLNQTSYDIFCDYKVRSALVRITGKLNLSPRIIELMQQKRFDELPIEMLTDRTVILQLLAEYPTKSLFLDHISHDLQNDIQFLLKAFKILKENREKLYYIIELPKLKLSTAVELMKMDNSLFQIIPKRFKKTIEFIPFIVALLQEGVVDDYDDHTVKNMFKNKELALQFINYIFLNQHPYNYRPIYHLDQFFRYEDKEIKRQVINEIGFEVMKKIVEHDGTLIKHAREEWKDNNEIAMIAVKQKTSNFQLISERLKMEKDFILQAIEHNANIVKYISNELQQDKEIWMKALKCSKSMKDADFTVPLEFERDRDVFKLMMECGLFPEYNIFRNDRELMLECVKLNPQEFKGLPFNLRSDREIAKIAITQDGSMLAHTSNELQNDREIIESAVQENGTYLACASELFKNDKQIVLMAVKQNGSALKFASEELKNDKQIVLEAISNDVDAIEFISSDLINDRDIALIGVKHKHYLSLVSNELRNDKQMVLKSVEYNGMSIIYASEQLQKDYDIILQAIITYYRRDENDHFIEDMNRLSMLLNLIPTEYKNNSQFMFKIITECDSDLIKLASDELKRNEDFILELISLEKFNMWCISKELRMRRTFIKRLLAIKQEYTETEITKILKYMPEQLQHDKELALEILKVYPGFFKKLPTELQNDIDFIGRLPKKVKKTLRQVTEEILIEDAASYILSFDLKGLTDRGTNASKKRMKQALEKLFFCSRFEHKWFEDEKFVSKIIELLKEPKLNCQILERIDEGIRIDTKQKIEITMNNPYYYRVSDLQLGRDSYLELMENNPTNDYSRCISDSLKTDRAFIDKASMISIHNMFMIVGKSDSKLEEEFYYQMLSKYLNKECRHKSHLIDYVMKFALQLEYFNKKQEEEYEDFY